MNKKGLSIDNCLSNFNTRSVDDQCNVVIIADTMALMSLHHYQQHYYGINQ